MKTLQKHYKEIIKSKSLELRNYKNKYKKYQSLVSKNITSEEVQNLQKELLNVNLPYLKHVMRHHYLAYATIRGVILESVELPSTSTKLQDFSLILKLIEEISLSYSKDLKNYYQNKLTNKESL